MKSFDTYVAEAVNYSALRSMYALLDDQDVIKAGLYDQAADIFDKGKDPLKSIDKYVKLLQSKKDSNLEYAISNANALKTRIR